MDGLPTLDPRMTRLSTACAPPQPLVMSPPPQAIAVGCGSGLSLYVHVLW